MTRQYLALFSLYIQPLLLCPSYCYSLRSKTGGPSSASVPGLRLSFCHLQYEISPWSIKAVEWSLGTRLGQAVEWSLGTSCGVEPGNGARPSCGVEPGNEARPSCGVEPGNGARPSCVVEHGNGTRPS